MQLRIIKRSWACNLLEIEQSLVLQTTSYSHGLSVARHRRLVLSPGKLHCTYNVALTSRFDGEELSIGESVSCPPPSLGVDK